jgi:hypothetical protein
MSRVARRKGFSWHDKEGEYIDLFFAGRKVTRYMYAHDTSSAQRTFETYKPFLHVFDELGQDVLTNGPDGVNQYLSKRIKYPHHRGVFMGWNKLTFEGKRYDLWHMKKAHQVHQEFLTLTAGPVLASSVALVHWNDEEGEPIIAERRRTTVYAQSDPTVILLDFDTKLRAVRGDVYLDGDPEHAGFQFRAHNDVAAGGADAKARYLFHEDGIDAHRDKDLPWVAMSFGLRGRNYSVLHMDHPENARPTIYSAYRDYGRFGAFFKQKMDAGRTLKLRYRIWVGKETTSERRRLASAYSAFVDCPAVEVLDWQ